MRNYKKGGYTTWCISANCRISSCLKVSVNMSHASIIITRTLMNNIEPNPGPLQTLTVITLNCRGLGNIDKTRPLLNKLYQYAKKGPLIAMFFSV